MSNRRVYIGIILSYLGVFLLPLIVCLILLNDTARNTQNSICESVQVNLEHTRDTMDNNFHELNGIVTNLTANTNICYLATQMTAESKNVEYSRLKQAKEYIAMLQVQTFVEEYYVYFPKPEIAVSPRMLFQNLDSMKFFFCYDDVPLETWLNQMQQEYNQAFFPAKPTVQNMKTEDRFLYVQSLVIGAESRGTFIFPIRAAVIADLMEDYYIPRVGWAYVLDDEKQTIVSIPSDDGEYLEVDPELITGTSGVQEVVVDGQKMELVQVRSDYVGLTYVAVIPEKHIAGEIMQQQTRLVWLTVGVLLIGMGCITLLSWRKGKRITQILQMIFKGKEQEKIPIGTNAMVYISQSVQNLIDTNADLRDGILRQEPVTRELLLERLLMGGAYGPNMRESLEQYGIVMDGDYLVVLFSFKQSDVGFDIQAQESAVYKQLLVNDLEASLNRRKYLCSVEMQSLAMVLSVDTKSPAEKKRDIAVLEELHRKYREEYGVSLNVAVSAAFYGWKEISKAYDQVCELMEYGFTQEKGVLLYEEYRDKKDYYYYPVTMEERLINAVKSGNMEITHDQLHQIFTMNVIDRELNPSMMHFLINDLQCTIYKILHGLGPNVKIEEKALNEAMEVLAREKELLNRFQHIDQIFIFLSEQIAKSIQEGKNQIIQSIAEYVEKNYQDQSMSLTKAADEFGYASTYFSRLFKEQFGMNFTSYLEKVRIDHVCRLLETEMTLEKIAAQTGYNSAYVLRTAFKRMKGMTPNDYRKENIRKQDEM